MSCQDPPASGLLVRIWKNPTCAVGQSPVQTPAPLACCGTDSCWRVDCRSCPLGGALLCILASVLMLIEGEIFETDNIEIRYTD